jgi:hypothetical protein
MNSSLTEHLNHHTTAFVAEVMSKWLDDEEINPFILLAFYLEKKYLIC